MTVSYAEAADISLLGISMNLQICAAGPDSDIPRSGSDKILFSHLLRGIATVSVLMAHLMYGFWQMPDAVRGLIGVRSTETYDYWFTEICQFLPAHFFGHFGVALFFLISGFVIPFGLSNRSKIDFGISRLFRIWPTYAVGLTMTAAVVWIFAALHGVARPFDIKTYFLQLLFVRDLFWIPSIDGIVWTLEIECKFYVIAAVMASWIRAGKVTPIIMFGAALAAFTSFLAFFVPDWRVSADPLYKLSYATSLSGMEIGFMFIGTVVNYVYREKISLSTAFSTGVLLYVSLMIQWPLGPISSSAIGGLVSYAVAIAIFIASYRARRIFEILPIKFEWLADISYSLYVIHGVPSYVLLQFMIERGFGIVSSIIAAFLYAIGSASILHRYVEKPTQAMGKRLGRVAAKKLERYSFFLRPMKPHTASADSENPAAAER